MGKLTRTQKIIARNKAASEINRLRNKGEQVPLELLAKANWQRKIVRGAL